MARVLVVINPFGGHEKGARITDSGEIAKILKSEHAHHVIQSDHSIHTDADQPAGE
jgi:hypothetical protein